MNIKHFSSKKVLQIRNPPSKLNVYFDTFRQQTTDTASTAIDCLDRQKPRVLIGCMLYWLAVCWLCTIADKGFAGLWLLKTSVLLEQQEQNSQRGLYYRKVELLQRLFMFFTWSQILKDQMFLGRQNSSFGGNLFSREGGAGLEGFSFTVVDLADHPSSPIIFTDSLQIKTVWFGARFSRRQPFSNTFEIFPDGLSLKPASAGVRILKRVHGPPCRSKWRPGRFRFTHAPSSLSS